MPNTLRKSLEADIRTVVGEQFASRFYQRLFQARAALAAKFRDPASQSRMLAGAIRDLVEFRREDGVSRFRDLVGRHRTHGIDPADIDAFRVTFVQEVIATRERAGDRAAPSRGDAWNAVLKLGMSVMLSELPTASPTAATR